MLAPLLLFLAAGWEDPKPEGDISDILAIHCTFACRTRDEIRLVIDESLPRLERCYNRALRHQSGLEGRMIARFMLEEDGSVSAAEVASSTLAHPRLEACVLEAVQELSFEPHPRCRTIVRYPFSFSIAE